MVVLNKNPRRFGLCASPRRPRPARSDAQQRPASASRSGCCLPRPPCVQPGRSAAHGISGTRPRGDQPRPGRLRPWPGRGFSGRRRRPGQVACSTPVRLTPGWPRCRRVALGRAGAADGWRRAGERRARPDGTGQFSDADMAASRARALDRAPLRHQPGRAGVRTPGTRRSAGTGGRGRAWPANRRQAAPARALDFEQERALRLLNRP